MAESKDYYELLGVSKDATDDELKKSYRKLAKKYHPDAQQDENQKKQAEIKFKEVNEAYSVLSDSDKRAQYDRFGSNFEQAGFGGGGYSSSGFDFSGFGGGMGVDIDLDDILGSVFGGGFGGFGGQNKNKGPAKGADLRYNMNISFEEAAFGAIKNINVSRHVTCETCHGSGAKPGSKVNTCDKCSGRGKIQVTQNTIMGSFATVKTCDKCNGEGKTVETPCDKCNKKGIVKKVKSIAISIPAGIDNGQAISLRGEGDCGRKGGPSGDLFVVININPHKVFTRRGFDILLDIEIPFVKMVLGGSIKIPTLEDEIEFNIPESTQPGTKFKLKDKGIQNIHGRGRGNLEFTVNVEIPKKITDEQRQILIDFANTYGDEVNQKKKGFFGL